MINLLLVLAVYCGSLYADFDSEGKVKTVVVSRRSMANFDDYEEEKLAKRQKKFGTRASSSSSVSNSGKRPISTVSRIFDRSKLGPVPSVYSDKKRALETEQAKTFVKEINNDHSKATYDNISWYERAVVQNSEDVNNVSTWHKVCNEVVSY